MTTGHPKVLDRIFKHGDWMFIYFTPKFGYPLGSKELVPFEKNSEKLRGPKIGFTLVNGDEDSGKFLINLIQPYNLPELVALKKKGLNKFEKIRYQGQWKSAAVERWMKEFLNGKLAPQQKDSKRKIELLKMDGPSKELVKEINGESFDQEVLSGDKNTLLLITAPWKRNNLRHEQFVEDVAKELNGYQEHLTFRKINGIMNNLKFKLNKNRLPMILFFAKENKRYPIRFGGKLKETDIKKFLMKHSKDSWRKAYFTEKLEI
jgi:hypothetical protein